MREGWWWVEALTASEGPYAETRADRLLQAQRERALGEQGMHAAMAPYAANVFEFARYA